MNKYLFVVLSFLCALSPSLGFAEDTGSVSAQRNIGSFFEKGSGERYNVRFRQASLREVLQFISWIADVNIMIPQGIDGVVSVSFRDITLSDAINSIVKANNLDYTVEGGVIRVGKGDEFRNNGEDLRTTTIYLKYATAKDMVPQVKTLLSDRGTVFADDRTNAIVIREVPANIDNARSYIAQVDIRDAQVLIEAKILEVTRSFSRSLGVQWGAARTAGQRVQVEGLDAVGAQDTGMISNQKLPATAPTSGVGILIGSIARGFDLDIQLSAAESRGDAYVVSDPSIVTSNGMAARIRSGTTLLINANGDVNIGSSSGSSTSTGGGSSGVQEIETGVELNVTPQISVNDYVKLSIETVTSTPDFSRAIDGIPVILDNTANTTVLVKDGETTVIGGLTRFADSLQENRVPGLSRVPLFGNLFKSKDKVKENSELMVFIKPSIVKSDGMAPVQVREHEVQLRQESMYIKPMTDPVKDMEKKTERAKAEKPRKGSRFAP